MGLLKKYLLEAIGQMERDKVKMEFFGDLSPLSQELRDCVSRPDASPRGTTLSGEYLPELWRTGRDPPGRPGLCLDCVEGRADPNHLTQENFSGYLFSRGVPDPDLIIRPSGELRLSNFLLWESAYAEFYFTECCCGRISAKQSCLRATPAIRAGRRFGGS